MVECLGQMGLRSDIRLRPVRMSYLHYTGVQIELTSVSIFCLYQIKRTSDMIARGVSSLSILFKFEQFF